MEQEDKELLIKEISARLPYGVKVWTKFKDKKIPLTIFSIDAKGWICFWGTDKHLDCINVTDCRLYLRPMLSMTDEELAEYEKADDLDTLDSTETLRENMKAKRRVRISKWYHGTDWLNAHHFDYRGLIEKGLALVASKDIYNG